MRTPAPVRIIGGALLHVLLGAHTVRPRPGGRTARLPWHPLRRRLDRAPVNLMWWIRGRVPPCRRRPWTSRRVGPLGLRTSWWWRPSLVRATLTSAVVKSWAKVNIRNIKILSGSRCRLSAADSLQYTGSRPVKMIVTTIRCIMIDNFIGGNRFVLVQARTPIWQSQIACVRICLRAMRT
jgi:hypothetical protein